MGIRLLEAAVYGFAAYGVLCFGQRVDDMLVRWREAVRKVPSDADE
jgi:hypothetical protein